MRSSFFALACVATLALPSDALAQIGSLGGYPYLRKKVVQGSFRWRFSGFRTCGRYVNGDWWVLGPVTITDITPATSFAGEQEWWRDGTMLNPSAVDLVQGLDNSIFASAPAVGAMGYAYEHNLNIAAQLPYVVSAGTSVVTCISQETPGGRSQVRQIGVLTVVDAVPAENSFRPVYTGPGPKVPPAHLSEVVFSRLQGLPTAQPATLGEPIAWPSVAATVDNLWYEAPGIARFMKRQSRPSDFMPNYGRDIQGVLWNAMLPTLMSNYTTAQKRDTVINLIQIGLDRMALGLQDPATSSEIRQTYGGHWDGGAGHGDGAKLTIYYAGWLLDDVNLMNAVLPAADLENGPVWHSFQEDDQPFVVVENNCGLCGYGTFLPNGTVDWGVSHFYEFRTYGCAINDDVHWIYNEPGTGCEPNGNGSAYRICCSANNWWGSSIISRVIADELGLPDSERLFTQAFYDYQVRYLTEMLARGYGNNDFELYWTQMQRHCFQAWDPLY
ncbi:MAG: hypothetical protein GY711_31600 [bacterium]|nr:hypothetical protein [bacterium]